MIYILLLFFFIISFFSEALFTNKIFFYRDMMLQFYPWSNFAIDSIRNYKVPLWNPYSFCGSPFIANLQSAVFYPFKTFLYLAGFEIGIKLFVIIHIFIAGVGIYILLQEFNISKSSAFISSIIFSFNGYIITRIEFLSVLGSLVWIPWIFLFYHRAIEKKSIKNAIITGIFLAIQFLAGSPQILFYTILFLLAYTIFAIFAISIDFSAKETFAKFGLFGLIFLSAVMISMVQLLPSLEFLKLSSRQQMDFPIASWNSFPPIALINFLTPFFFGNPTLGNTSLPVSFWITSIYIGILPLLLILFLICNFTNLHKNIQKLTIFFLIIIIFAIIIAFGKYTPVYHILYNLLPGFNVIRYPAIIMFLVIFSASVLAGFGMSAFESATKKNKFFWGGAFSVTIFIWICLIFERLNHNLILRVIKIHFLQNMNFSDTLKFVEKYNFAYAEFSKSILILSVSVLVLWGYKKSKHYLFSVVPILCLVIDLFNFGINLNPLIPASILKEKSKFARILEKDTELFRVIIAPSAFSDFNSQHFHPFLNEKIEDITPLTDAKTLIFPNLNIPFKIQHFNGYDPMRLSVYEKMQNTIEKQTSSHDTSILDFANVKYIISNNTLTGKNLKLVDVDNRVKLYKNMSYFPRVYFENKNGGAKLVEYNPEKIIIDVNVKKQDNLILADMFYPGWQVYVNEKKDKILPTKYYFREVNLLPGKYTVKFIYNPLSFRIGMFISLFTIIGIVSFFLINWRYENKIFQK